MKPPAPPAAPRPPQNNSNKKKAFAFCCCHCLWLTLLLRSRNRKPAPLPPFPRLPALQGFWLQHPHRPHLLHQPCHDCEGPGSGSSGVLSMLCTLGCATACLPYRPSTFILAYPACTTSAAGVARAGCWGHDHRWVLMGAAGCRAAFLGAGGCILESQEGSKGAGQGSRSKASRGLSPPTGAHANEWR